MLRTRAPSQATSTRRHFWGAIAIAIGAALVTSHTVQATIDTVYVDNTKNCPGGPGTSLSNAYCSIVTALNNTGGPDKVVAVVGNGQIYRETGTINVTAADSGTVGHPFVLLARGNAIIDAADATSTWTAVPQNSTMWRTSVPAAATTVRQVFLDGVPYPYVEYTNALWGLPAGRCQIAASVDSVYVNFGSHANWTSVDPTGTTGYITLRNTIVVAGSNVTVQGFTVRRSNDDGIHITGPVRNVTVTHCDVRGSYRQGIMPNSAASHHCTISDNVVWANGSYGVYLPDENTDFSVLRNNCAYNLEVLAYNNTPAGRSSVNGIRLGDRGSALPSDTTQILHHNHLLEGNVAHHNQDSGIEIRTNYTTSRNNQSYSNQDHGFDHLWCTRVTHIGDLSWGNNRDGMSFENGSHNIRLRNCVMANNGRDRCRYDWELEFDNSALYNLNSDFNVLWREADGSEPGDSILINVRGGPQLGAGGSQCGNSNCISYPDSCFGTLARFRAAFGPLEASSRSTEPAFVDSGGADFRPLSGSPVIDAADTSGTWWVPRDVRGFVRHDQISVANAGYPSGAYGDAGPYEFDDGAAVIDVSWGYENLIVTWAAPGVEQNYGTANKYEVYRNGSKVVQVDNPEAAGSPVCVELGSLPSCSAMSIKVKYTYVSGFEVESNTVSGSTTCSPSIPACETYLGGGGGSSLRKSREERETLTLSLEAPTPSPSRGASLVRWELPTSVEGMSYDLSLFDVAGRRVWTVVSGVARAGRYGQVLSFETDNGVRLRGGVFFMRLRVGPQALWRTVVLTR